jgi:BASS family bile acid:Na+ symporter
VHSTRKPLTYIHTYIHAYVQAVAATVSIETGMQNSALGVVLATRNFADPLTALPVNNSPGYFNV